MAVLAEAISVFVRVSDIHTKYPGGWEGFRLDISNQTLCSDNEIARVGFMTPSDLQEYVRRLEMVGFKYLDNGTAIDLVVVDQMGGPTTRCDWIEFGKIEIDGHQVAACRMVGSKATKLFSPDGWRYEGSLSQTYGFVPSQKEEKSLKFLRHHDEIDFYLNLLTGKEVSVARSSRQNKDKERQFH